MSDRPSTTILVTGGAGFIGGALINRLLSSQRDRVVCVDNLSYAANRSRLNDQITGGLEFHDVDISHRREVSGLIHRIRPRLIFHLAAESHVDRSIDGPVPFVSTNVVGTANLLEAALGMWQSLEPRAAKSFRFVHISTDEVFGSAAAGTAFTEATSYDPQSPYAASKAGADHLVRAWHATFSLPTVVTNSSNNYGPFQFPEKLIPHIVVRALLGQSIPVYGDGQQVRDWMHVEDHVDGLLRAASRGKPGGTYLFGARNALTNQKLAMRVCSLLDEMVPVSGSYADRIEFVTDRPGHDRRYAIDPSVAESQLGWRPDVSFDLGLKQVVAWYVQHEDWWRGILDAGYDLTRRGERR